MTYSDVFMHSDKFQVIMGFFYHNAIVSCLKLLEVFIKMKSIIYYKYF